MHFITADQLHRGAPLCKDPAGWVEYLNEAMLIYGISDDIDYMVEFLSQCAHETLSFNRLEENLSFSAERLMQVWPKRFPSLAIASQYASSPHKLANFVYGSRMGNSNEYDGWNYRGRGMPMITGKDNYRRVGILLNDRDIVSCPDKLCTKKVAALAGAAWWSSNPKLNTLAQDQPGDDDHADFVAITRIVNGGTEGLTQRAKFRDAFKGALVA